MGYEELLVEAEKAGLIVKEKMLPVSDGRIKGKRIAIRRDIPTLKKKADVLAEELGHYYTSVGRIVEQDTVDARKQERRARLKAYNMQIPLVDIIKAYKNHCRNVYEMSEFLDVSEDTIKEALEAYRQIYGNGAIVSDCYIQFEPYLIIQKYMEPKQNSFLNQSY